MDTMIKHDYIDQDFSTLVYLLETKANLANSILYSCLFGVAFLYIYLKKNWDISCFSFKRQHMDAEELNGGCKSQHIQEKRKEGALRIWNDFIAGSTLHGLHFIFERRPLLQRIIWFLLQGLMTGLFIWQTLTLVFTYFEYKVSTRIELVSERVSNFPAVTLCNFNKYRKGVVRNTTSDFYKVLTKINPLNRALKTPVNWTKYPSLDKLDMEEFIYKAGHQLRYNNEDKSGMLYYCSWKGNSCTYEDFMPQLTDMGLCYTFNSGENNMTIRKVGGPGKYFGLHLRMSIEQPDYIGHLAFSAGLRIRVHDPDEPPLVSGLGFAVMPGSHVFASISRQDTISLEDPYTTMCKNKKLPGINSYTIAACHESCKEKYIAESCSCRPFYMKDTGTHHKPCTAKEYLICVIPLEENFTSTEMARCDCPEPCETMKYNAYLSYGQFPSIEASRAYANNSSEIMDNYTQNLLAIDIFYEDLNYNLIKQVPAYSLQNLLGEIGGMMGLFLGASTLTLFEFFDVILMTVLTRFGIHRQYFVKKQEKECKIATEIPSTTKFLPFGTFPERI